MNKRRMISLVHTDALGGSPFSFSLFLSRENTPLTWFLCSLLLFLFSPALPLIVVSERVREGEVDKERQNEARAVESGEGKHPSSLRWGPGHPAATAGINTHHPDQSPSQSLPLPARPLCLPAKPAKSRARVSREDFHERPLPGYASVIQPIQGSLIHDSGRIG